MIEFHCDAFSVFTGCMEFQYGAKESAAAGDSFVSGSSDWAPEPPRLCARTKDTPFALEINSRPCSVNAGHLAFPLFAFFSHFIFPPRRTVTRAALPNHRFGSRSRLKFFPKCHAYEATTQRCFKSLSRLSGIGSMGVVELETLFVSLMS